MMALRMELLRRLEDLQGCWNNRIPFMFVTDSMKQNAGYLHGQLANQIHSNIYQSQT